MLKTHEHDMDDDSHLPKILREFTPVNKVPHIEAALEPGPVDPLGGDRGERGVGRRLLGRRARLLLLVNQTDKLLRSSRRRRPSSADGGSAGDFCLLIFYSEICGYLAAFGKQQV